MKSFKEILHSKNFAKNALREGICTQSAIDLITKPLNLRSLLNLLPNKNQVILIMPSKRNKSEILIAFKSYPVCVEFNKYHAQNLLHRIHANDALAKALNLQEYTKITGYTPKNALKLTQISQKTTQEIPKEKANPNFTNHAINPKIHAIFEEIRQVIITNIKLDKKLESQKIDSNPSDYYISSSNKFYAK